MEHFRRRGTRNKRRIQMTQSETCYYALLSVVLSVSVLGIIWSTLLIYESNLNIREHWLQIFNQDEAKWNQTYLNQMKSININIITDGYLYNRHLNAIETEEIYVKAIRDKNGDVAKINESLKKIEYLKEGLGQLKIPLKP